MTLSQYIVWPSILSLIITKPIHKTKAAKKLYRRNSYNLIYFKPGSTFTGFRTTQCEAVSISILTCQLSSFFVQTLRKQRQLCTMNGDNFVRTTLTLQGQRQLCTNNVHTLYEQRQLCKDNDNLVRTTSTLVRTAPNPL